VYKLSDTDCSVIASGVSVPSRTCTASPRTARTISARAPYDSASVKRSPLFFAVNAVT
jgi:hypothetical protein